MIETIYFYIFDDYNQTKIQQNTCNIKVFYNKIYDF